MRLIYIFLFVAAIMASCVPHKEVIYFNDLANSQSGKINTPNAPDMTLQPRDVVEIDITSISKDANAYFQKSGSDVDRKYAGNTYQISGDGTIDLPLVGEIEIGGKTVEDAEAAVKAELLTYLQKPSVNIRLVSFQITVLGEVNAPGIYDIPDASVSLLEAIGYAGDITIFGKRNNVMLIRNTAEGKEYFRIDLNNSESLNTQYFHLQNNDVIYVEPSKGMTSRDDNFYRILPLVLSTLTFVVVLISLSK